ncbi:MAG: enoyl-CoA hydratase [Minwuia thermotolerans]|nr:MAG: enoyl-CoA hydratase [Minwuia thermotolerans]
MTVRIEKDGHVWTVIHHRPEARNAMDPESSVALNDAFLAFERDEEARVAVFFGEGGAFCAGWDLKHAAALEAREPGQQSLDDLHFTADGPAPGPGDDIPRGPMGPSRLELDKPVIGAIAGPAVAGGMELAMWCDFRVMEESAYMGVYCRRWGIPLIDGGTVRLPRLVGQGRAMEIILTGRKVPSEECMRIGLCEHVVADGTSRQKAEELAQQIARFPQNCMRADRRSAIRQHGLSVREGLAQEWQNSRAELAREGITGAARFRDGKGRGGDFADI